MALDSAVFLSKFVEEARDCLKALDATLLRLEQAPGTLDALDEAMRNAHTLKGSALMLGFSDISTVSHQLEDLFVLARRDPGLLDARAFDLLFSALDTLSARADQLAAGVSDPIEITELCRNLAALGVPSGNRGASRIAGVNDALGAPAALEQTIAVADRRLPELRQSLRVPIEKLDRLTNLAPEMVIQSLKAADRHAELRRLESALSRLRDRVRETRLSAGASNSQQSAELGEYADALDTISRRMRDFLVDFSDDRVRLNLITEELRQNVIELTMLPLSTVFDAFPRAVRDLARTVDKDIDLTIRGRETELDKKIIEQVSEPLIHLMRNAVDHGIETRAQRVSDGKPAAGQVLLSAEQQGNRIVVLVRDDGRGIDPDALRTAASAQGIATPAEMERWTPEEVLDLIFQPGLSTRGSASDVSGRGIGMDVVKSVVVRLGGAVRVQSERGRGTTVVLDLPLSLALLRVVLIEVAGELFALPTAVVRRILRVASGEIPQLQEGLIAEVRGETVPLMSLAALLELPSADRRPHQTIVVAEIDAGRFGLVVDAIHEEQELVFKELRGPLRTQRTFTGAALLGNGHIVPILDARALFELASKSPSAPAAPTMSRKASPRASRVLVVEDSLVAGELQKNILVSAGYEVDIAKDGAEALEMLRQRDWDLVVADVDMPRIDGFELTTRLRADDRFRNIPVIIVTARDSIDDRRRGFEAGADAYVLKRDFDQNHLLDTVRRLIGGAAAMPRLTVDVPLAADRKARA